MSMQCRCFLVPFLTFFFCLKLKYKLKKLTLGAALLEKDAVVKAVGHASQSLLPGGAGSFGKKQHEQNQF